MHKTEVIQINISTSFMKRTLCPECGKGPDFYYPVMNPFIWKDAKYFVLVSKYARKWVKRMNSSWYVEYKPRHFTKLGDFTFTLEGKSYNPTAHRVRGADITERDNITEFVGCECGATIWAFNQKSRAKRPEVTNRKGRYKYPQKFVY
jgi:predicted RNA-binding Zn-ribbon protein involved in translation (DUF1610 family)